jgi:hypothetical protein
MQVILQFLGAAIAAGAAGVVFQMSILAGIIACILAVTFLLVKSEVE